MFQPIYFKYTHEHTITPTTNITTNWHMSVPNWQLTASATAGACPVLKVLAGVIRRGLTLVTYTHTQVY